LILNRISTQLYHQLIQLQVSIGEYHLTVLWACFNWGV